MSEETWYKMLVVSFVLHILVVGAFSITFKSKTRRFDLSSSYSVNLVGGTGGVGVAASRKSLQTGSEKNTGETHSCREGNKSNFRQKQTHSYKERRPCFTLKKKVPEKRKQQRKSSNKCRRRSRISRKRQNILTWQRPEARGRRRDGQWGFSWLR